jgi:sugar/nucleoside kinase (ribokinase family)
MTNQNRKGIACAGNWIVDRLKVIDTLPSRGMLANIFKESYAIAGAPANVLQDLAQLQVSFPLAGIGVVGNDRDGAYIKNYFGELPIDITHLIVLDSTVTSYTDVMTERKSGDRTFFHLRGANAQFNPTHVPVETLDCRIFHLGYLLLLDSMDKADSEFGTVAASLLRSLQLQGIKTSLDVVSEDGERFKTIVPPALKYVDYLIINEIEAGKITNREVRRKDGSLSLTGLEEAVAILAKMGTMECMVIHMPEGSLGSLADGTLIKLGSLELPDTYIAGSAGAGDAFCAGVLYGIHEEWPLEDSMRLATCCAAASLSEVDGVSGVRSLEEVMALETKFNYRKF